MTTRMSKVKIFLKYAYPLKRYSVLKVDFSAILLLKIFKFQNDISLEWIGMFQKFFPFWHPYSEFFQKPSLDIILYWEQNLVGTLWRHFPTKNVKIWKTKNIHFFWMVGSTLQNFKKLKNMNKGEHFWCHIYPLCKFTISPLRFLTCRTIL